MGNQQKRQMNTQILNKNELVINAEEEDGRERKQMDMVNTEKRKEKQEVQLLNYQKNTPAFSKKQNKSEAKKSMKTTERKVKAEM